MKLRQCVFLLACLAVIATLVACGSSYTSTTTTTPPVVSIAATSGSGQSAVVGAALAAPLVATVTTGGSPTANVTVTFTAPTTGASGAFAGGVNTATTNASGVATSPMFTANSTAGSYAVTASVSGASNPASFSLTNTAAPVESIAATSGTPQNAAAGSAFAAPLVATVTTAGTPNANVTVTFTAPASGASGTFATTPPSATATVTTDSNGVATSPTFTANATLGVYTVTASASGVSTAANFSLTNVLAPTLANAAYVFSLAGQDQFAFTGASCASAANTACGPYFVAGAFQVSNGTITGGEQDFIDSAVFAPDAITGGAVTATANGNLQITLTTADTRVGVNGVETLNGTLVSTSSGLITEFDASATSSGFLAQQTPTVAAPSGGYAFVTDGIDTNGLPVVIGGVINVDGVSNNGTIPISGTGSVFDINDNGTVLQNQTFNPSTVTVPDQFGRVIFSLNPSGVSQINLAGYVVGPKHIWLAETLVANDFNGTIGGEALGQGSNTGQFLTPTASPVGSSYVFGSSGVDGLSTSIGAFQVAGVLTLNSDGTTVSGTLNSNDLTGTGTQSPIAVTGTYTVDATGRVTVSNLGGSGISNATIQLYLSGDGNGTLASMDTADVLAGLANQQTGGGSFTASSFSGLYATNASGFAVDSNGNELEFDDVGLVSADGVSALAGTVDQNFMIPPATQSPGVPVSGAFTTNASGVFTGTITGLDIATPANNDAFTYYMIDTTKAWAIETDANQLTLIRFALQQ